MRAPLRIRGAAIVEFALVVILLILLVFGLIELGRALFKWNSAVDATRRGARIAAIVRMGDRAAIVREMRRVFPEISDESVTVEYSADGLFTGTSCARGTCRYVRVGMDYTFRPLVFFLPASIAMPHFSTTYPVEALGTP